MENKLWNVLKELKSEGYEWVELSHSLNNDSPFWSGIPEGSVMPDSYVQIPRSIRHSY